MSFSAESVGKDEGKKRRINIWQMKLILRNKNKTHFMDLIAIVFNDRNVDENFLYLYIRNMFGNILKTLCTHFLSVLKQKVIL